MIEHLVRVKNVLAANSTSLLVCLAAAWLFYAYASLPVDSSGKRSIVSLVFTPDQQGQRYMKQKNYKKAAAAFTDLRLKGAALYRGGQFKEAATVFARQPTPVSLFNQGTAYIMAGRYDDAIESLEKTLEADPGFEAARINLEIAKIRKEKRMPPKDDNEGTGGMLGADEIVFSDQKPSANTDQTEQVQGGNGMSDAEMRSLWLRRLSSRPKDFLRVKFAYQHTKQKK